MRGVDICRLDLPRYQRATPFVSSGETAAEDEEDGEEQKEVRVLCIKGCGFFGSKDQKNMCSQCFKKSTA